MMDEPKEITAEDASGSQIKVGDTVYFYTYEFEDEIDGRHGYLYPNAIHIKKDIIKRIWKNGTIAFINGKTILNNYVYVDYDKCVLSFIIRAEYFDGAHAKNP
jgi:hypothetical protein